jgi:protein involved in polysaccharide export with SLBB domain
MKKGGHLKSKLATMLGAAVICVFGPAWVLAGHPKQEPSSQPDPVMESLRQGVNHLDGVPSPDSPALQRRGGRYQIENSDVLDLKFSFTPDFNQTVTVQPDGYITVKEIGDLRVEGETLPQIKENLQRAYSSILAKPVITVYLQEFEKPYFLAMGQVGHPGKYDLHGNITVAAAVAMAGGFTSNAKHSQVLLFRRVNSNWSSVTKINLKHMLKSRSLREDPRVEPGDMVYIPKNLISKIKTYVPTPTMGTYATAPLP